MALLTVEPGLTVSAGEQTVRARLRVAWHWPGVPVEVLLAPWSSWRSELRVGMAGRRRYAVPWRFFEAAHAVADGLRDALLEASQRPV